jgi:hypothetical protein
MFRLTDIPAWTLIAKGGVVFVWFALFFVAERLAPAVQPWRRPDCRAWDATARSG